MIEDPVILVGDLFSDHIQPFSIGQHHEVFRRVVQIAAIVHVDMIAPAVPACRVRVGDSFRLQSYRRHCARADLHFLNCRLKLNSSHRLDAHLARGKIDEKVSLAWK